MVCFQDGWGLEVAWAGRPPVTCTCGALERWRPQKVCSRDGWGHEVAWAGKPPATCVCGREMESRKGRKNSPYND
eukprot:scaffold86760_cov20-Tisochrysis_lutea.AAC.3